VISKQWIKVWSIILIVIPVVGGFNYMIDPYGYNNHFIYYFNENKKRLDERIEKFNLIKQDKYNSYVFGASRNTFIDPERIEKHLSNVKAINSAFSAATIDEIELYINYIIKNNKNTRYVFIPIDLFSFGYNFKSSGTLPSELLLNPSSDKNIDYMTIKMLRDSIATLHYNLTGNINNNIESSKKYIEKGMRFYNEYLSLDINGLLNHVKKNVFKKKAVWHDHEVSNKRIRILKNLHKKLTGLNVKVFIYTNPITYQQIIKGKTFLIQLDLLNKIVNDSNISVYDFNNINNVNLNNYYFYDIEHYNYNVADCIIDKMLIEKSECGNDFGKIIDHMNIKKHIMHMKRKYKKLKRTKLHH
jgi:hypothetical protein